MRNVKIAYVLTFLKFSWFWLGIWVFYYLRYTDYAGIGIIESIVITVGSIAEIPTGAVADLLGKRWTLFLAFLIEGLGSFVLAFAPNYTVLLISLPLLAIGSAFYSGTLESLVYDSLKDEQREKDYGKTVARISTIELVAFAISSILGGIMYRYSPGLPYVAVGILYAAGAVISLTLSEPNTDSEKFTWKNYLYQTKQGFGQLLAQKSLNQSILLIMIGSIGYVIYQSLNDILGVEFGFTPLQWSLVSTVIFLVSAVASGATAWLIGKLGKVQSLLTLTALVALSLLISPTILLVLGGIVSIIRFSLTTLVKNISSILINETTEPKYRATTLSTFNLLSSLPYAFLAYFLGAVMNNMSGRWFAFWIGLVLLVIVIGGFTGKKMLDRGANLDK